MSDPERQQNVLEHWVSPLETMGLLEELRRRLESPDREAELRELLKGPGQSQWSFSTDVPSIDLNQVEVDPEAAAWLPRETCERLGVLPLAVVDDSLVLAMVDPQRASAVDEVVFLSGSMFARLRTDEVSLWAAIERTYPSAHG